MIGLSASCCTVLDKHMSCNESFHILVPSLDTSCAYRWGNFVHLGCRGGSTQGTLPPCNNVAVASMQQLHQCNNNCVSATTASMQHLHQSVAQADAADMRTLHCIKAASTSSNVLACSQLTGTYFAWICIWCGSPVIKRLSSCSAKAVA